MHENKKRTSCEHCDFLSMSVVCVICVIWCLSQPNWGLFGYVSNERCLSCPYDLRTALANCCLKSLYTFMAKLDKSLSHTDQCSQSLLCCWVTASNSEHSSAHRLVAPSSSLAQLTQHFYTMTYQQLGILCPPHLQSDCLRLPASQLGLPSQGT